MKRERSFLPTVRERVAIHLKKSVKYSATFLGNLEDSIICKSDISRIQGSCNVFGPERDKVTHFGAGPGIVPSRIIAEHFLEVDPNDPGISLVVRQGDGGIGED